MEDVCAQRLLHHGVILALCDGHYGHRAAARAALALCDELASRLRHDDDGHPVSSPHVEAALESSFMAVEEELLRWADDEETSGKLAHDGTTALALLLLSEVPMNDLSLTI